MNVLIINASPHVNGTTAAALSELADTLKKEGINTETVQIGHKAIRGCIACYNCSKTGKCTFDDAVNEVAEKFEKADGFVIGSPVYYASANGTAVSFMDRLFCSTKFDKTMKVGAAVACARRGGTTATFDQLNKYFTISGMPVASSQYWNQVHGKCAEDAKKDKEGMQTMRTLGRNMAFLIKSIAAGADKFGLPEKENKIYTNFID